jgi:hypothetical protein
MSLSKVPVAVVFAVMFSCSKYNAIAGPPADKVGQAMELIQQTANSICGSVPDTGSRNSLSVQGEAKAQLPTLLKKLADIGISGTGTYSEETYGGVLQEHLADELKDLRHCKETVFIVLLKYLFLMSNQKDQHPMPDWSSIISSRMISM